MAKKILATRKELSSNTRSRFESIQARAPSRSASKSDPQFVVAEAGGDVVGHLLALDEDDGARGANVPQQRHQHIAFLGPRHLFRLFFIRIQCGSS